MSMQDVSSGGFYANLPLLNSFIEVADSNNYHDIPNDWSIVVTDVKDSTKAIEAGRYKDVNMIGASSIVAILNIQKEIEIPFIFGGDGASILVPNRLLEKVKESLLATVDLAKLAFNLELRVGIVPVQEIQEDSILKIAKYKLSSNYTQAMFTGGGLTYAEKLVKNDIDKNEFILKQGNSKPNADFSGLECRWQDILSKHGEIISLLVSAVEQDSAKQVEIYQEVITFIDDCYGDENTRHPVSIQNLNLAINVNKLSGEVKVTKGNENKVLQTFFIIKHSVQSLWVKIFKRLGKGKDSIKFNDYKKVVQESTDFMKFDDTLRMVISGTKEQRIKLLNYLETRFQEKKLIYGLHVSDRAMMTCLVFERMGSQVHFIDGADGGYALAAKDFKRRLKHSE